MRNYTVASVNVGLGVSAGLDGCVLTTSSDVIELIDVDNQVRTTCVINRNLLGLKVPERAGSGPRNISDLP